MGSEDDSEADDVGSCEHLNNEMDTNIPDQGPGSEYGVEQYNDTFNYPQIENTKTHHY
jgi:hypothetical protein